MHLKSLNIYFFCKKKIKFIWYTKHGKIILVKEKGGVGQKSSLHNPPEQ